MRPKSLALLLLALGCGLVASIGITQVMTRGSGEAGTGDGGSILIAAADIPLGTRLTPAAVKLEPWPKDKMPVGAILHVEDVENRRARSKLCAGQPILDSLLSAKGANQQGATAMIPVGYRVVPVKVDLVSGGSDLILPGDRVNVMVHLVRDINRGINETVTRTILQDIKVFAVNDMLDLDKEKEGSKSISAKTISLLVTPEQAAKIMLASQLGILNLVMRSSEDDKTDAQVEVRTGDLLGASGGAQREKEESQDQPAVNKGPVVPPAEQPGPRDTWKVRVLRGGTIDDVVFEKDSDAASPADSWRLSSTTNVAAGAPSKEEPKAETPPARPPIEPVQETPKPTKQNQIPKIPKGNGSTANS